MTEMEVAQMIYDEHGGRLVWCNQKLYEYDAEANRYQPKNEIDFDDGVRRDLHHSSTGRDAVLAPKYASLRTHGDVIAGVRSLANVPATYEQPCWIRNPPLGQVVGKRTSQYFGVANGNLDLERSNEGRSDCLIPSTADLFTLTSVNYKYDRRATCPRFIDFMDQLTDNTDAVKLSQEWMGYCLRHDHRQQKLFVMHGEGGTGKSTFAQVMRNVIGPDNCSSQSLKQLGGSHGLSPMEGKLLNISDELEETDKADEATIKTITGGQPVSINPKYKTAYSAVLSARLMFTTNNLPHFRDRSDGFWRRMLLVQCNRQWKEGTQDRDLTTKLLAELPGILNWALEGLRRLTEQDGFTRVASSEAAIEQHRNDCNPVREFLRECVVGLPSGVDYAGPTPQKVIGNFRTWATALGKQANYTGPSIGKEIRRQFPNVALHQCRASDGSRHRQYAGIAFIDDIEKSYRYRIDDFGNVVERVQE